MKKETSALLATIIAECIFGFSFMFSALAFEVAEPVVLLAVRFVTAFLILNLIVLSKKVPFSLKGKPVGLLLAMGLFQPILYFLCENYGIYFTSTALSGTMIALIPVVNLVLSYLLLREKATKLQVLCAFAAVFGVLLTTAGGSGESFSWIGFFLLTGAVFSACLYNISSKKASAHFNALEKTYVQFGLGSLVFVIILLFRTAGQPQLLTVPLTNGRFWIAILYLSALSSVGSFMMLNYAFQYTSVNQVAILSSLSTVISIAAGILILREPFTARQIAGAAIIILSVYGVTRPGAAYSTPPDKSTS